MKLFSKTHFETIIKINSFLILLPFLVTSCATHHPQFGKSAKEANAINQVDTSSIAHTFYLVGDAGNADQDEAKETLELLHQKLRNSSKNASLLFLGDNIYPVGFSSESDSLSKLKLNNQLALTNGFKGNTIFIPGNHDWYSGIKGLELQADFVTTYLNDKKSFLPRKGCAIEQLKINNDLTLLTIDSEWFLQNWDKHPTINDNCEIKTRDDFFSELESLLNKNQSKTLVIAMHHPLLTNGTHGGQFSVQKQLFPLESKIPLPFIGSIINFLRQTSGASPQDLQNKEYAKLANRIKTLIQGQKNIVVVSGHDHNLQFIQKENITQVISGAGSKSEAAKAVGKNDFSYGGNGYATLQVYKNGSAKIAFYGNENNSEKLLFAQKIIKEKDTIAVQKYALSFPTTTVASIYSKKSTEKGAIYSFLFGKHYRATYSLPIETKTVILDTLFGGVTPTREGGGHQSKSLRIVDQQGREYVMRAMKKSATQFLQSVAFKDQYIVDDFTDTYSEEFLFDFYTTAYPYAPFAIGSMADKIGVAHTNPFLYYIPKQNQLGTFNSNFGDELYLVEERVADNQKEVESFGENNAVDIISTTDMMKNLQKDEKYSVDQTEYIKARLFDMLIGDWDRHDDQWRWAAYQIGGKVIYKPIPRDRDQAFPKFDGAAFLVIMNIPALRHMRSFDKEIDNIKWFNREPYPLDLAFLKTASQQDWISQASQIKENLNDNDIEEAFANLPKEVQGKTLVQIKQNLKTRRDDLEKYAAQYYAVLQHTVLIVGTNKKDKFVVHHKAKNTIEVSVYRIKKDGDEFQYSKEYKSPLTKNLWIYGLDDDDVYEVNGTEKSSIKIRLIGGQNNDVYTVSNGKKVKIYDYKSKKNTLNIDSKTTKKLTDDYALNLYDYQKPKYNVFSGMPTIGYNPDDNFKLGFTVNYTVNQFKQSPFTQKHVLKGNYYFGTQGIELMYNSYFPEVIGKWGLDIDAEFTTPNFTMNFFGYGNETKNNDEEFGMNYNRVRIQKIKFAPALKKSGRFGSELSFQPQFELYEVESTTNRYINIPGIINPNVFLNQVFGGAKIKYSFINADVLTMPTMGINFSIAATWTSNLEDIKRNFPALDGNLSFSHKIDSNGKFVFATNFKAKKIFNNNFEFYQGALLGGDFDLRGFRDDRFLGNSYYSQSTDVRWNIGKIQKRIVPLTYGVLAGFDYGRVWLDGLQSDQWHSDYGGGLWINAVHFLSARATYFKAPHEKGRFSFGVGFNF
ncbi:metallophosphoesterase [Flavobacterium sp. TMP13]|uniref:metallophosphoesterase n=1 Tax=Flavobacterium sp. TMP13 TaxID=3425950 RepID=UPI003D78AE72